MCSSSIQIDDNRKKMFLLLCVDIPQKEVILKPDKKLYAFLGVFNPIVCTTEITESLEAKDNAYKVWEIGTEEEFNHRRRTKYRKPLNVVKSTINIALGEGSQKKNKAIERFQDKEKNYVDTKLHTYSRMFADMAIKHECSR